LAASNWSFLRVSLGVSRLISAAQVRSMIVLDTNVISEVFHPVPSPKVLDGLQQKTEGEVFTTAITRGEMLFGAHILPKVGERTPC